MKVITSIYLKLRPDLRDEWLTQSEVDDVQNALVRPQDMSVWRTIHTDVVHMTQFYIVGARAVASETRQVL